eukprot:2799610-Pyramimonas_sp.AAC.1
MQVSRFSNGLLGIGPLRELHLRECALGLLDDLLVDAGGACQKVPQLGECAPLCLKHVIVHPLHVHRALHRRIGVEADSHRKVKDVRLSHPPFSSHLNLMVAGQQILRLTQEH